MTEEPIVDDQKRTIVLIYGILTSGSPFWVFAAVKPSKYPAFQEAYHDGTLNIHEFQPYGEVLVCGEGKGPPDIVTLKVAAMYQTDPKTLMGAMVEEPPPVDK